MSKGCKARELVAIVNNTPEPSPEKLAMIVKFCLTSGPFRSDATNQGRATRFTAHFRYAHTFTPLFHEGTPPLIGGAALYTQETRPILGVAQTCHLSVFKVVRSEM